MVGLMSRARGAVKGWNFGNTVGMINKTLFQSVNPEDSPFTSDGKQKITIPDVVKNAVAMRCVSMISDAASAVPVYLGTGDDMRLAGGVGDSVDHPALTLLNNPSPGVDRAEYLAGLYSDRALHGEWFAGRNTRRWDETTSLVRLRPERVQFRKHKTTGAPLGIESTVERGGKKNVAKYRRGNYAQSKTFNPQCDYHGLSPFATAGYGVVLHNRLNGMALALAQNGNKPAGVLSFTGDNAPATEAIEEFDDDLTRWYRDADNAGKALRLPFGVAFKSTSMNSREAEEIQKANKAARETALAAGVPPMLLGIPGDNTYSNYKEARIALYTQTVMPLVRGTLSKLSMWMIHDEWASFKGNGRSSAKNLNFLADWMSVPVIADWHLENMAKVDKLTKLTFNEARKKMGYGDVPGGDRVLVSGVMTELDGYGDDDGDDDE